MRIFAYMTAALLFIMPARALASDSTVVSSPHPGIREVSGSFLRPLGQRDSVLVADQLMYGFRLDGVQEGTGFAFPDYSKGFRDSVEVISPWILDTLDFRKGKKGAPGTFSLEGSVVITSFDEGDYLLPPISVLRQTADGTVDTLLFNPQTLEVKTIPVDTAVFQIHDIKGQIRYPLTLKEILPYLIGGWLFAVLVILVVCLVKNVFNLIFHGSTGGIGEVCNFLLGASFVGVAGLIYKYTRYGISAMEMTTKEIFDDLRGKDIPADIYEEMKGLFERADFVKFAKYVATDEENASAVPAAVRFVTQTYQSEVEAESENAEGKEESETSRTDVNI